MIVLIIIGVLSGFFTLFLNYCMGKPGSKEFSPYEIFSSYTVWLSKMRLKNLGVWEQHSEQYHENLKRIETKAGLIEMKNDFKKIYYEAADKFFTWERSVGMCAVCTGVWISLIVGILYLTHLPTSLVTWIYFAKIFVHLLIIVVISHITIRLLNKII